jgi:hypothetical protein
VDGLIPSPVDKLIAGALDELCPQLESTPLLQEKVGTPTHLYYHVHKAIKFKACARKDR